MSGGCCYDLIFGNATGAREANNPDLGWVEASVATTRLQEKNSNGDHSPACFLECRMAEGRLEKTDEIAEGR